MYWPHLATALMIAMHVWGPVPCGTPVVKFEPMAYNIGGAADIVNCEIDVNQFQRMWYSEHPDDRCTLIVHEWGHLAGRPHSPNPLDVMYGAPSKRVWKECVRGHKLAANRLFIHADRSLPPYPSWEDLFGST